MKSIIGIVTIGISPRYDIQTELDTVIDKKVEYLHIGALDDVNEDQLTKLKPVNKSDSLVTIYKNNQEVKISHNKITEILYEKIKIVSQKSDIIVMACTGYENLNNYPTPILFPGTITENLINYYSNKNNFKLGVIQPTSDQIEKEEIKWKKREIKAEVHATSPYTNINNNREWETISKSLKSFDPDLIYLNCMGMKSEHKSFIQKKLNKTVLLATHVTGSVINDLL
ncbi:MAG: hypothetical protein CL730_03830 [Chloroflexi bacterium]|nr:hypothetical protein [Chloroflexota bacterium]|tara:strand:- start:21623 stop:22303 length:681 start_codon:yes stop_codon:yes gene_type:complete